MKKILAAILTALLVFSPIGNVVFQDESTTVEAKKYRSGQKSFNPGSNNTNNHSLFQNKKADQNQSTNKSAATTKQKGAFSTGGFMKGLMLGGLAGILFGGLLANMGILGSMLGLFINVLAIAIVISLISKIFSYFKNKKKREEPNPWRG